MKNQKYTKCPMCDEPFAVDIVHQSITFNEERGWEVNDLSKDCPIWVQCPSCKYVPPDYDLRIDSLVHKILIVK
jgi:hypothetical protein